MTPTGQKSAEPRSAKSKKTVLISDPEPFVRDTLRIKLASKGYHVITASTGRDTVRAAARHQPTLVLTEINYIEPDGYKMCQMLKGHDPTAAIPIVVLTSLEDTPERKFMFSAYVEDFLNKPFSPRKVAQVVDRVVRSPGNKG